VGVIEVAVVLSYSFVTLVFVIVGVNVFAVIVAVALA
jgi:hypothetical protein